MASPGAQGDRPSRLNRAAAWVGILAGVVFIVATIFFSGFVIGIHAGGSSRGGGGSEMNHRGGALMCPGGKMGRPGQMGMGG